MRIAHLIILTNVSKRYSYIVPSNLTIDVGDYVNVTFAKRKQVGLVVELNPINNEEPVPYALSEIHDVDTKRPRISEELILLSKWFSTHYCTTEYRALQCIVGTKKIREAPFTAQVFPEPLNELSPVQRNTFDNILGSPHKTHLIHGVTGSGKTQVYAHLIHHAIERKETAILLIPEISLTPQFTSFFSTYFSGLAVVHSGLTAKRKEEIWSQCNRGEISIIIGPRSAIFMPLKSLGVIIVDEEHDASYKQESAPRYFTHEVAKQRAKMNNALLVFGSATPSLTTYAELNDLTKNYHQMLTRFNSVSMPKVHVLDMNTNQTRTLIHDQMVTALDQCLKQNKKVLIMVNRRGYSSFLKCRRCGTIQQCNACNTSYTYHSDGVFRCHRCLETKPMTRECTNCKSFDVEYYGIAIQKVHYELMHLFPDITITRIDRDNVKNIDQLQSALEDVTSSDILIGTQMIAKGHNFPNVGMVGIIGIDVMLNFPDFRASERMFQLITQMAGRAGRDHSGSHVYIQSFQPNHYVFSFAKSHDSYGFLKQENEFRLPFGYPPFKCIVNIIFSAKENEHALKFYQLITQFNATLSDELSVDVIGPKPAPIEKASHYYRHNVFYKISQYDVTKFKQKLQAFPVNRNVRCVIDIDPQSLL